MDAALYRIGKGKKISASRVDRTVLDYVRTELESDTVVRRVTATMQALIDDPVDGRQITGMEKKLAGLNNKIGKLIDLVTEAEKPLGDAYKRSISQAEAERAALVEDLSQLRQRAALTVEAKAITPDEVRGLLRLMFENLSSSIDAGEQETIKAALGGLIERIELDPVSEKCTIHCRIGTPDTGVKLASPRGFEPLYSP